MKKCAACKETKPAEAFRPRTDRGRASLRRLCKPCENARRNRARWESGERTPFDGTHRNQWTPRSDLKAPGVTLAECWKVAA
jgi:hypothetical protein